MAPTRQTTSPAYHSGRPPDRKRSSPKAAGESHAKFCLFFQGSTWVFLGRGLVRGDFFCSFRWLSCTRVVIRPLPYRAFLDGGYNDDGAEVSVVLPGDFYKEVGAGIFRGDDMPFGGSETGREAWSAYVRLGGDVIRNVAGSGGVTGPSSAATSGWKPGQQWLDLTTRDCLWRRERFRTLPPSFLRRGGWPTTGPAATRWRRRSAIRRVLRAQGGGLACQGICPRQRALHRPPWQGVFRCAAAGAAAAVAPAGAAVAPPASSLPGVPR